MSTTIMDGQGGNRRAGVISDGRDNRLLTSAESIPYEGNRAISGNTGVVHYNCVFGSTSSGALMSITNASPDRSMQITRMYFDAHLLANPVEILLVKQPTSFTGGVDVSDTANVQKNYGSQVLHPLTISAAGSGTPMTYVGGTNYHDFVMSSLQSQQRNMNATNIIAPGTTMLIGFQTTEVGGHNMVAGESLSLSISYISVAL